MEAAFSAWICMWIKIGKGNASFGLKERTFSVIHSEWLISEWYLSLLRVFITWQLWKNNRLWFRLVIICITLERIGKQYLKQTKKVKQLFQIENYGGFFFWDSFVCSLFEWSQKHLLGPKQNILFIVQQQHWKE